MAKEIYMPRLGQTMQEGTIIEWLKKEGDPFKSGDDLFTLEYDKATINIQSMVDGMLQIVVRDGTVPVGTIIAMALEAGEAPVVMGDAAHKQESDSEPENTGAPSARPAGESSLGIVKATPRVRKYAKERGVDLSQVASASQDGTVTEADIEAYLAPAGGIDHTRSEAPQRQNNYKASPLARKLAAEYGISLSAIQPADGQRIGMDDVELYMRQNTKRQGREVPMSGIRKVIAQRMTQSAFTAPAVSYSTDADMTEMSKLRMQLNDEAGTSGKKISYTDLIIKAVATALRQNMHINISLEGETILYKPDVNIGVAVATEKGLLVPVIKNADGLSVSAISEKLAELSEQARAGALSLDDMTGGTFTISNLGMYDVDMFTPIINQPESAILGIGRITEKVIVEEGQFVARPTMTLSLTADHRVIDGAPAAPFLQAVKKLIERPEI